MLLKLEHITTIEQLEALQDEWNGLLPHNATNEVFLTWQWQTTWWDAYHPGDLWMLAARNEEGKLVGVAPWFREHGTRVLRSVGCVEVTDYLDVLVLPDYRDAFFTDVVDFVREHADEHAGIDLCNIPGGSPTMEILPRLLQERGFSVAVKQQEVCPIIPLPDNFEAYLEQLDKKQRHESRRKLRRAEDEGEGVEWYIVGAQHDLKEEIEKFIKLMAASHPEKAKFLEDDNHTAFFRTMVPRIAMCGWLQLAFLTINGEPAAAYMNFDYGNRILVYNSGLEPEKYSYLSPGIVLLLYTIRHAIEQGRVAFDFLRGNEGYKYRMGGQDHPVMMIEASLK